MFSSIIISITAKTLANINKSFETAGIASGFIFAQVHAASHHDAKKPAGMHPGRLFPCDYNTDAYAYFNAACAAAKRAMGTRKGEQLT